MKIISCSESFDHQVHQRDQRMTLEGYPQRYLGLHKDVLMAMHRAGVADLPIVLRFAELDLRGF